MSKKYGDALLDGIKPHFVEEIDRLNFAFKEMENRVALVQMESIGKNFKIENSELHLRKIIFEPLTSDGYKWWIAMVFDNYKDQIILAFPRINNNGRGNRSVALYTKEKCYRKTEKLLVDHFADSLFHLQRRDE